jgi:hypothetical protein
MAEEQETPSMVDEPPPDSPTANADRSSDKRDNSGCLVLFLLAMPVLDTFGVVMTGTGVYCQIFLLLGLMGFVSGATVGALVSVKIKRRPWYASCRWATYGLLGMCVPSFIFAAILNWLNSR